jgi:hypothetical protein
MSAHKTHTPWTWWIETRPTTAAAKNPETEADSAPTKQNDNWDCRLTPLAKFTSIEEFLSIYSHLSRPSTLFDATSVRAYYVFRNDLKPTWEQYAKGGHWIVTLKRSVGIPINLLWETLLLSMIGEQFGTLDVVGCVVVCRRDRNVFQLWVKSTEAKLHVGTKLEEVLKCAPGTLLEFKSHRQSIADHSGSGGTETYKVPKKAKASDAAPAEAKEAEKPVPAAPGGEKGAKKKGK